MDPVILKITGMSCQHCSGAITKALTAMAGVERVEVSLEEKTARIWGQADENLLIEAVEKAGFTVD